MSDPQVPLPQYDDLTVGEIESHVRTLDREGVQAVSDYERAHAARPAVLLVLKNRAAQLREGAEPTGGSAEVPGAGSDAGHTPAQAPVVEGPPVNPPSQGAAENPAQPRR